MDLEAGPPCIEICRVPPPPLSPPAGCTAWCACLDTRMVQQGRQTCATCCAAARLHLNVACFWPDLNNVPQQNSELIYESYPDYLPVWSPVTDRYQSAFDGYTLLEKTENIDDLKSDSLPLK